MAERTYVTGIPVALTIQPSGTVTIDFDVAEIGRIRDLEPCDPGTTEEEFLADAETLSAVAARLGNCFTTTIHPARPTA